MIKRIVFIGVLILLSYLGFSQVCNDTTKYFRSVDYGWNYRKIKAREAFILPSDTICNKLGVASLNNKLFIGDGVKWTLSSGVTIDTTSLSNRINLKLSISDTSSMLSKYLRSNLGVKYTDTSLMLTPYFRKSDTISLSNQINQRVKYTDTSAMLQNYATKALVNTKLNISDTTNKWVNNISRVAGKDSVIFYIGSNRYAIKDSTGGSSIDTTSLSKRINAKADTSALNLKLNISDTASMLSPYLKKVDTASLSNRINLKLNISDTTNKWVNSVTKLNDSTIRVIKNNTTTDITLTPASTVTSATRLVTTVYNNSGSTITKGSVVYISGAHSSNLPTIALAKANQEETSAYTYGLVETDITNNNSGIVIQGGTITNLNLPTSSYTDGQTLYLSPTVAGGYTTTKPLAPNHYVAIGTITRAHPNFGTIQIAIRNGFQLDEMSDVQIPLVPNDSTLLQFSRVDSLWHSVSPTNAIPDASATSKGLLTTGTQTIAGTKSFSSNIKIPSAGSQLILQVASDGTVSSMPTATYPSPIELSYVKGVTSAIQTQINGKVNISDSASMLSPYLRKIDTASLSSRINLKVNIADTSSMLTPYLRKIDTTNRFVNNISRTIGKDSIIFNIGSTRYAIKDSTGAGSSYTFSTGLTNTSGTVTSNLSTGVSGGQSVVGGTAASDSLTISSTSNATKGKIKFGTSTYFENTNRFGINTSTDVGFALDVNGTARVQGATTISTGNVTVSNGNVNITGNLTATNSNVNNNCVSNASQIIGGNNTANSQTYRLINGGTSKAPQGMFGAVNITAGTITCFADDLNGFTIGAGNGTRMIGRASINITNLVNTAGSESGDMIFSTQSGGTAMSEKMRITSGGGITLTATNTASGTTGNQTINKASGTVNIAAAGTTVTVTNSLVTASSIVFVVIRTNDATATIKNVVPGAGSFVINLSAATTAETSIGFFVIN